MTAGRRSLLLLPALALAATFSGGLGEPFFLRNPEGVLHLPLISSWRHLPAVFTADFMMFTDGQYRPLAYALLALVRSAVSPEVTWFWHLWLLGFHWLNAVLAGALVQRLGGGRGPALFAATLVAVHPVGAVVVNDPGAFHHLLGLSFFLGALYLYVRARERGWRFSLFSLAGFAVGLFANKVLFSLPLVLLAYEALYRRTPARETVVRLAPFALVAAGLSSLWWGLHPHPLHYTYAEFPEGANWFSLFSVVGAIEWYGRGLFLGWGVPAVLHDSVEQVFGPLDWRFVGWAVYALGLLGAGGAALRQRRWWGGLGVVVIVTSMLPFATTFWNSVEDYLAWKYAYCGVAGVALLLAGTLDSLAAGAERSSRAKRAALWIVPVLLGIGQMQLTSLAASPVAYWSRAASLPGSSETAGLALGRAHLERGQLAEARWAFFAGSVGQLHGGSAALCRYFAPRGELLPAAIHLRMAIRGGSGLQFAHAEPLLAELMHVAHAYDHAEAALGKVLTANPYDVAAMARLAEVWVCKGYVAAAEKLQARVLDLDPGAPAARRIEAALEAARRRGEAPSDLVRPPSPSWLRYVTQGMYDSRISRQIVRCSEEHRDDPIIQLEAATCLIRNGRHQEALATFRRVTEILPNSAYAWAMRCWAAAEARETGEATAAGRRALELDSRNATVHNTLGILFGLQARSSADPVGLRRRAVSHFREALGLNPRQLSAHLNLARELRHQGQADEAIRHYRQALRLQPDCADAHFGLGNLLADEGDVEGAIESYEQALASQGDHLAARHNLGAVLAQAGRDREAVAHFRRVLQTRPDHSEARDAMAVVLMRQGRYAEAASLLREGLTTNPGHTRGALMLASLLATCPDKSVRDPATAAIIGERLCRALNESNVQALQVTAAAHAAAGNPARAVEYAERALELARRQGHAAQATAIASDLERYRRIGGGRQNR